MGVGKGSQKQISGCVITHTLQRQGWDNQSIDVLSELAEELRCKESKDPTQGWASKVAQTSEKGN